MALIFPQVKLTSERLVKDVQRGVYGTPAKKPRLSSPPASEPEESEMSSPEKKSDFTSLKKQSNLVNGGLIFLVLFLSIFLCCVLIYFAVLVFEA